MQRLILEEKNTPKNTATVSNYDNKVHGSLVCPMSCSSSLTDFSKLGLTGHYQVLVYAAGQPIIKPNDCVSSIVLYICPALM